MSTEPHAPMTAHTGIELLQAAASTNLVASIIGEWARGHGFDEEWEMADKLEALCFAIGDGSIDDGPKRQVNIDLLNRAAEMLRNNIIAAKLALIHSEVSEALDSLRDTGSAKILTEGNFGEELADIEIRVKHLANLLEIDLGQIEIQKIKTNATRPYKHGREM